MGKVTNEAAKAGLAADRAGCAGAEGVAQVSCVHCAEQAVRSSDQVHRSDVHRDGSVRVGLYACRMQLSIGAAVFALPGIRRSDQMSQSRKFLICR